MRVVVKKDGLVVHEERCIHLSKVVDRSIEILAYASQLDNGKAEIGFMKGERKVAQRTTIIGSSINYNQYRLTVLP